jgi:hypothetical protein
MLQRTQHRREASARGGRVTDLEKGQPCPACRRRGCSLSGATDVWPPQRPPPRPPPLGQHCCPNGPCQILPRRTRLVHDGIAKSFPFVAATHLDQARTGPRSRQPRNAVAPTRRFPGLFRAVRQGCHKMKAPRNPGAQPCKCLVLRFGVKPQPWSRPPGPWRCRCRSESGAAFSPREFRARGRHAGAHSQGSHS